MFPKSFQDRCAFSFLSICVLAVFIFDLWIVLPDLNCHLFSLFWFAHFVSGIFIVANIYGNLCQLIRVDTSTVGRILPSGPSLPGWHICSVCESLAPPRSFHCSVCNRCILKRDHHCIFVGSCIGLHNFRYFLSLLIHIFVGCLYATLLHMRFIWVILGGFDSLSVLTYLFPFVFWFFGFIDVKAMVWTMLCTVTFLGMMFVAGLFCLHVSLMLKNQTTYEKNRREYTYNLGWRQNIIECLGNQWKWVWVFPTLPSELPSDGLHFATPEEFALRSSKNK